MKLAAEDVGIARVECDVMEWLHDSGHVRDQRQALHLVRLISDGTCWELALTYLQYRVRLSRSTLAVYVRLAEARHRLGVCLFYGTECPALGGLAGVPAFMDDAWCAVWGDEKRVGWRANFADLRVADYAGDPRQAEFSPRTIPAEKAAEIGVPSQG